MKKNLDFNFCMGLLERIKVLDQYPKDKPDLQEELAKALQEAPDKTTAEEFVENWLRIRRRAPMPADIYAATKGRKIAKLERPKFAFMPLAPGEEPPEPEYFCNKCQDSGWYTVVSNIHPWDTDEPYTGAKRCTHPPDQRGKKANQP